jgi:hypothetical protein
MTRQALLVIEGYLMPQRGVRIMTSRATDAWIVTVALAAEDTVGLKADVMDVSPIR